MLALVADLSRRASLAKPGVRLAEYAELEREPGLAAGFEHVVLVDPPPSARLAALASAPTAEGGYLREVWGEREQRFAIDALEAQLAQRPDLIQMYREIREAGAEVGGEELRRGPAGRGPAPPGPGGRRPLLPCPARARAWCGESTDHGAGTAGVVSSERTDLERSAAFRAYSARYQEGLQYLEGLKQS